MARLVTGMEVFRFDLAVNSGLLNKWQPAALVLSGLIPADPLANQDPVPAVALDAVSSLDNPEVSSAIDPLAAVAEVADEAGDALTAANDIAMPGRSIRPIRQGMLNEEEALRMILRGSGGLRERQGSSLASSPVNSSSSTISANRTRWKEAAKGVILSSSAGENSKNIATRRSKHVLAARPPASSLTPTATPPSKGSPISGTTPEAKGDNINAESLSLTLPDTPEDSILQSEQGSSETGEGKKKKTKKKSSKGSEGSSDSSSLVGSDGSSSDNEDRGDYSSIFASKSNETARHTFKRTIFGSDDDDKDSDQEAVDTSDGSAQPPSQRSNKARNYVGNEVLTDSEGDDDFTNVITRGHHDTRQLHRRMSSSTTSSARTGTSSNMIPCLSGFIDSWNPFPGDQRYFDIPPSQQAALGGRGDEPASHKVP